MRLRHHQAAGVRRHAERALLQMKEFLVHLDMPARSDPVQAPIYRFSYKENSQLFTPGVDIVNPRSDASISGTRPRTTTPGVSSHSPNMVSRGSRRARTTTPLMPRLSMTPRP